jgi:pimeloyl-ACP methyl ester carboxylesterase
MKEISPIPVRHHRLRLPQGTIFWHEAGRGDTVLFLHGTWHDSSQWGALLQTLAPTFHCVAPDFLGFGESSAAFSSYSIALETETLEALLTQLRVEQVYVVAHSLGAWVGFNLAQQYPDRVQGIIVMEPEGFAPQALGHRWTLDRWLIAPWSPLAWGLQVMTPLQQRLRWPGWLSQLRQRRQRLRHAPAATQLLFRRRQAEIGSEMVTTQSPTGPTSVIVLESAHGSPQAHHLSQACLQSFPHARHQIVPEAANPLGLKQAAVVDALSDLIDTVHDRPIPDNPRSHGFHQPIVSR